AELFDADAVVEQEFARVTDAQLGEELGVSLARPGSEIPAEGIGNEAGDGGHLAEGDLAREMTEGVVVDRIDAVVLLFGKIGAETDGRQQTQTWGGGECGKALDQGDDTIDAFGRADVADQRRDLLLFFGADQDAPPRFFEQAADRFGLGEVEKGVAPEILGEMNDGRVHGSRGILAEMYVIVSPVMGEIATYQDDVAGLETFDVIADELGAAALVENDDLILSMGRPPVVDERVPVFAHAKGMGRGPRYF